VRRELQLRQLFIASLTVLLTALLLHLVGKVGAPDAELFDERRETCTFRCASTLVALLTALLTSLLTALLRYLVGEVGALDAELVNERRELQLRELSVAPGEGRRETRRQHV
jgi:hypothetical protein